MPIPEAWSGTKIWSSEVRISVLCSGRILPGRVLSEEAEPFGETSGGPGGLGLHQIHTGLGHHCSGGEGSLAGLWIIIICCFLVDVLHAGTGGALTVDRDCVLHRSQVTAGIRRLAPDRGAALGGGGDLHKAGQTAPTGGQHIMLGGRER